MAWYVDRMGLTHAIAPARRRFGSMVWVRQILWFFRSV